MSPIKKRIHRLFRFVELLQSGRYCSAPQLADIFKITRRTVFRDIRILRDCGVDVRYDRERRGYHFPALSFRMTTDLSQDELRAIFILCSTLDNTQDVAPYVREARLAVGKLAVCQPKKHHERLHRIAEVTTIQTVPRNVLQSENSNLATMQQAAIDRHSVRIQYEDASTHQEASTLLSPYRLVFGGRDWYVVGRSSIHRSIRTFALHRLLHLETTDYEYKIPSRFDLDRYFQYGDVPFVVETLRCSHCKG